MALAAQPWRVTALPVDKNLDWALNLQIALGILARSQLVGQIVAFARIPDLVIRTIMLLCSAIRKYRLEPKELPNCLIKHDSPAIRADGIKLIITAGRLPLHSRSQPETLVMSRKNN
ncbi:hypothetical protein [Pseudomonas frederiksbergensis]|uniref:Uncharacterized protein n=1 Tax=Pseudomonas frederiksbergensis TaxID=104087 RepID=A0A423KG80_9PSED|nr:hypothetical protein [Pseudomonas frederiksbergensis]RON51819.1 hypothetical protein BK665_18315 [Pseudomonas frederiksbergensis]